MLPSIENEVHRALKDVADEAAIKVFAENVRKLLLASPFGSEGRARRRPRHPHRLQAGGRRRLGPATSASNVMHLQTRGGQSRSAQKLLGEARQERASIRAIAVGNGTAGRETETFVREALQGRWARSTSRSSW